MKFLNKIASLSLIAAFLSPVYAPIVQAQSVLDDIKTKLNDENIQVIDYSAADSKWGSLPDSWVAYFSSKYDGIAGFVETEDLEKEFIGSGSLTELRRELAIMKAEKILITVKPKNDNDLIDTLEEAENVVADKKIEILEKEIEIKTEIAGAIFASLPDFTKRFFPKVTSQSITSSLFGELEKNGIKLIETRRDNDLVSLGVLNEAFKSTNDIEGKIRITSDELESLGLGVNAVFAEINFYYNYSKWGRLPLRLIGALEGDRTYNNLQEVLELNDISDADGQTNLREELEAIDGISTDDAQFIIESLVILNSDGERQINEIARSIANLIKNIAGAIAILWIVVAGARMMLSQGDENIITEQKRSITYAVFGLVAILLIDKGIDVIYGAPGEIRTELTPDQGFTNEVLGLVTYLKAIIGSIAILMIVVSGMKTVFAAGEEDQITEQKKSVMWIVVGIVLILIDEIIVENFFIIPTQQSDQIKSSNITTIINTMGGVLQFLLGFVGIITLGILVYGASTMIMNYGNDEMVEKSKKIIKNAIIGILVILSAYVIVASLVVFK